MLHIYTSSFFKFRNKANFYSFLGASAGTGAPRNTQKIGTRCGCEYGYKNYESFGSLLTIISKNNAKIAKTMLLLFFKYCSISKVKNSKGIELGHILMFLPHPHRF